MAAFQHPASFLVDSVFLPNVRTPGLLDEFIPNLNQFYSSPGPLTDNHEGSSIDASESSSPEKQSICDPSSVTEKQRTESLSMSDKADSGDHVTQNLVLCDSKRKYRRGYSFNSANSKGAKQGKSRKQKGGKEGMKDLKNDKKDQNKITEEPPKGYIHVRARRGQATDSHSLAERVRREKISERMRMLQALVPGCDKVTGKAVMLDEIINYVQSLQNQVEFLSMKLASMDPTVYNFGLMDIDNSMAFETEGTNNGMALSMPLMQPTTSSGGSTSQPQAFANTNALTSSTTTSAATTIFPGSLVDGSGSPSLFHQEQKPSLLPLQDGGSLYWGVDEQQRQSIINQFGFNSNNLYCFQ